MATATRQAASGMAGAFAKATDLHKRILFVLGAFIVFRFGTHVPIPGVDTVALAQFSSQMQEGLLGMINLFTGGAFSRASILALNIIPYILASILVQLMAKTLPGLQELEKEGEAGRRKINQYTRYVTVVIAFMNGMMLAGQLQAATGAGGASVVVDPGLMFRLQSALTMTAGTMFVVWLAEQINKRGIGNGASLLIFAGIVAELPRALVQVFEMVKVGSISEFMLLAILAAVFGVIAFAAFVESAQRRILVQYPKRQVGLRMTGGEAQYMPLKVNLAGVMGPILASQILMVPSFMLTQFFANQADSDFGTMIQRYLDPSSWVFNTLFVAGIMLFSFWWVALMMDPAKMADRIKKEGGFVPGIRPGDATAKFLDYVMTRLTVVGAVYVAFICVLPQMLIANLGVPFYFGGTSLLIVVSVTLDTMQQIQAGVVAHRYEGLIRKARLRQGKKG